MEPMLIHFAHKQALCYLTRAWLTVQPQKAENDHYLRDCCLISGMELKLRVALSVSAPSVARMARTSPIVSR